MNATREILNSSGLRVTGANAIAGSLLSRVVGGGAGRSALAESISFVELVLGVDELCLRRFGFCFGFATLLCSMDLSKLIQPRA